MRQIRRFFCIFLLLALLPGCGKRTTVNLAELQTVESSSPEETEATTLTEAATVTETVPITEAAAVKETAPVTEAVTTQATEAATETAAPETQAAVPADLETQAASEEAAQDGEETSQYVLNINSKKIHLPSCESVGKMKESNKKVYEGSILDLEAQGYVPCKLCKP